MLLRVPGTAFLVGFVFCGLTVNCFGQNLSAEKTSDLDAKKNATDGQMVAAGLFPGKCAAFVEVGDLEAVIDLVLDHPLRKKIEEFDDVKKALKSKQMFQFRAVVALIEGHVGMPWKDAIAFASSGGVHAAFDPETEGVALIACSTDEEQLKKMLAGLVKLSKMDPKGAQQVKEQDYRGLQAYEVRDTIVAVLGTNLLVSNKGELAKKIADNFLDGTTESLATNSRFLDANSSRDRAAAAWAWVDLEQVRHAPKMKKGLEGKPENIGVEFLIGGLQSVLKETPYAAAELHVAPEQLKFSVSVPHDPGWIPESREFFFGENGKGVAPAMLVPEDALINVTTYRDLSRMWLAKEDLLSEKEISQLAQADSTLSTLFGGLNFGEEVLGAAKPGVQFIAKRQDFSKIATPEPEVKLPSFALVFQLHDPDAVQRRFKVAYQSMVGFLNIQLGMQEMPQLDLETITRGDAKIISATYLPDVDGEEGLINYNFSPTIAFKGDHFIVSSTVELAAELVDLAGGNTESVPAGTNTLMRIEGPVLTKILEENRQSLISQNMLEKGHNREEAEKEIGILLDLMELADDTSIRLFAEKQKLNFEMKLGLKVK